jgi:type II secretion system protein H
VSLMRNSLSAVAIPKGAALPGRRSGPGFQLIELMVVLVVLGIVLAAAVPNFTHRNSWARIEGAAREMSARMQTARSKAVAQRVPYRLVLDRYGPSYVFERRQDDSTWVRDPDRVFEVEGTAGMTTSLGGDPAANEIYFETRGTVRDEDSPAEVRFTNAGNDTATVRLVRTGRVTVHMSAGGE